MPGGLTSDPAPLPRGPLAIKGQVHVKSGTNTAVVVGLTPGEFAPVTGPVFFGLNVTGPAAPFFMNPTQSTAILNLFTSALQGLVPASGGGTANFLRADGTWAVPPGTGGGGAGWDDVLAVDVHTGAFNPCIDDAQYVQFGIAAPPATGQIRTNEPWEARGDKRMKIRAGEEIDLQAVDSSSWTVSNGGLDLIALDGIDIESTGLSVEITAATDIDLVATAGDIVQTAGGFISIIPQGALFLGSATDTDTVAINAAGTVDVNSVGDVVNVSGTTGVNVISSGAEINLDASTFVGVTGGFVRFIEKAASTPAMAAGQALFWVKNDAPNNPFFTDDTNADRQIATFPIPLSGFATIADDTFLGNVSGGVAVPSAVNLSTLAGAGLVFGTHTLNVTAGAGGSLVVGANDIQRAALTGAITALQDSNATAFGALAAKSVLANATNASAVPAALAGSAAFQHLRVNSGNTGLEWSVLTSGDFPNNTVPTASLANITAKSVLANATNATAAVTALAGSVANTYLRVNAGNTALEFGALPAAVTPGWDDVLAVDATSGANDPIINVGRFIQFGLTGPTTGSPQLRSGDAVFRMRGSAQVIITGETNAALNSEGVGGVANVQAFGAGGNVSLAAMNATGTASIITNSLSRLVINGNGEWVFPSGGAAGTVLHWTSGGPPTWASVALSELGAIAANTYVANATAGSAAPTAVAVSAESIPARTSGNLGQLTSSAQSILLRAAGSLFFATAAADQVLRRSGSGDLGFGTLVTNNIGDDQVTFAKTQNIATDRFLGRITAASGNIEELTPAQATSMLDPFTSLLQGVVPASGGGTTNFLRADGTFAAPPGGAPTSGNAITATGTQVDLTGSTSAINTTPTAGALGVFNIATLQCGGRVTFQSVTEASIAGFTAKTDGFFFFLHIRDDATSDCLTLLEETSAVSTAIRTPNTRDWRMYSNDTIMLVYMDTRWRVCAGRDRLFLESQQAVAIAAQQNNLALASRGTCYLRFTLTGSQNLTGIVPDTSANATPNGQILVINNADAADGLNLTHDDAASTAANRFSLPGGLNFQILPGGSVTLRYDGTSSRWKIIGSCTTIVGGMVAANTLNLDRLIQLSSHRVAGNQLETTADISSLDQPALARILNTDNGTGAYLIKWLDEDFNKGVRTTTTNVAAGSHLDVFNGVTGWSGNWFTTAIGATATFISQTTNAVGHNGVIICTTGATSGNGIVLYHARDNLTGGNGEQTLDADDFESFDFYLMLPTVTSVQLTVGIGIDCSVAQLGTDSIYFDLNAPTDTSWHCVTRAASTNTDTDSGIVAAAGVWVKLSVYRNSSNNIEFRINNLSEASHSANITTQNVLPGLRLLTNTAATRSVHVDRIRVFVDDAAMIG